MSVPRSVRGSIPAYSSASQATSSIRRCCGSIASASRGPTPKNPASNSPASCRKPPSRVYEVPGWSGSGSYRRSRSQPRSVGKAEIASAPDSSISHSSSGELTPPGKRQPMPTIATGSS